MSCKDSRSWVWGGPKLRVAAGSQLVPSHSGLNNPLWRQETKARPTCRLITFCLSIFLPSFLFREEGGTNCEELAPRCRCGGKRPTPPPVQEILPRAHPQQALPPPPPDSALAGSNPLTGQEGERIGVFSSWRCSPCVGIRGWRGGGWGTSKTALAHFHPLHHCGRVSSGKHLPAGPGAEMEPIGAATLCQATDPQPLPPQSWGPTSHRQPHSLLCLSAQNDPH